MEIPQALNNEIINYCKLNNITDIDSFILKMIKQGFTVEKYGATPKAQIIEKVVEKVITNDDEIKKLHEELLEEKNKNIELNKKIDIREKIKDIYGES
jgi:hypothetical protein